jgi:hypothetical protein
VSLTATVDPPAAIVGNVVMYTAQVQNGAAGAASDVTVSIEPSAEIEIQDIEPNANQPLGPSPAEPPLPPSLRRWLAPSGR